MEGAQWMDIRHDRQKVLSYTEIARKYHMDPRTAKKYAESEIRPAYSLSNAKPSKLDPYKEQIKIWLEEAPYLHRQRSSVELHRIQAVMNQVTPRNTSPSYTVHVSHYSPLTFPTNASSDSAKNSSIGNIFHVEFGTSELPAATN